MEDHLYSKWECSCIRIGIFQGDALSPIIFVMCLFPLTNLLCKLNKGFVIDGLLSPIYCTYIDDLKLYAKLIEQMLALVNIVRVFSSDIRTEFGFDKCSSLRGIVVESGGIGLPTGTIKALAVDISDEYLRVLEAEGFKHAKVKSKVKVTYKKSSILNSRLSGCNQIRAINSFAVPLIRYTAGIC